MAERHVVQTAPTEAQILNGVVVFIAGKAGGDKGRVRKRMKRNPKYKVGGKKGLWTRGLSYRELR